MRMQKSLRDYPKKGYIYIANLNPGFGREIHKKRPVVIISNNNSNQNTPYAVVVPTSSLIPRVISAEMIFLRKIKGLDKDSMILPLFIRSIDQDRLIKKVGRLSKQKLHDLEEAIKLILGFTLGV